MSPQSIHITNKRFVREALAALAEATPGTLETRLAAAYHPGAEWRGSHPMNEMHGVEAITAKVWGPLIASFPDLERRDT
ncbi:MAG: ester cyclase, partial [Beijerinckiaceae bacterium]